MATKTIEMSGFDGPVIETTAMDTSARAGSQEELVLSPHLKRGKGHMGFEGASVWSAISNLSTSIIGAGIMGLAATFKVLGIPLGFIFLLAVGFLTEVSLELLVKTTTTQHVWSYSDLIKQEFGNRWRIVLDLSVIINNLGICCVYLIVIADVLSGTPAHSGLLPEWNGGVSAWWTSRFFVVFVTMIVFLVPLASLKHVDSLHWTSALSVVLALVFVVVTVVLSIIGMVQGTLPPVTWGPDLSNTAGAMAVFSVIPVMATAYVCHFNVHPIYVELRDRTETTMISVCRQSLTLCTVVYALTALSGNLLFGAGTDTDLLVNFNTPSAQVPPVAADVVRVSYVLHIILVFPVIFYSLRHVSDDFLFPNSTTLLVEDNRRFAAVSAVWMVLIYLLSVLIPNLWLAFTITGATTTMLVGMVFPGMLGLRDQSGSVKAWEKKTSYVMLVLAVFVSITGIVTSIYYIVHPR